MATILSNRRADAAKAVCLDTELFSPDFSQRNPENRDDACPAVPGDMHKLCSVHESAKKVPGRRSGFQDRLYIHSHDFQSALVRHAD